MLFDMQIQQISFGTNKKMLFDKNKKLFLNNNKFFGLNKIECHLVKKTHFA